jgi:hypothetical protein
MIGFKNSGGKSEVTQGVSSFKENMTLEDDRILDVVPEAWWKGGEQILQRRTLRVLAERQRALAALRQREQALGRALLAVHAAGADRLLEQRHHERLQRQIGPRQFGRERKNDHQSMTFAWMRDQHRGVTLVERERDGFP